jgi:hypothetical protein
MAIDVFHESLMSFDDVTKRLPRTFRGKRLHVSTLHRWVQGGLRSRDGQIVRLEMVKVGGQSCTSEEALQRFFDRLTGDQSIVTPPTITRRQRLRQIEAAEEKLRRAGI